MSSPIAFTQPPLVAGGDIYPKRIIGFHSTEFKTAIQAAAGTVPAIGISEMWTRYVPNSPADDGKHAVDGEQVGYRGPFQIASLTLGGTVTDPRVPLMSDGDGKGVVATTGKWAICFPLETGVSGEDIDVFVVSPFIYP